MHYLLANGRNPNYLSFLQLDLEYIRPVSDIKSAVASSDDILFCLPSSYLEAEVTMLEEINFTNKRISVSIKGIVSEELLVPSVFLSKRFAKPANEIIVLAGPCHAEEIALNRKTFLTIAGVNDTDVRRMAGSITSHYLTVIVSSDPAGIEYAAILKNVIGITSGMVKGMNYGDNFLAVVISNAMREIRFFLAAIDDQQRDLFDSAYFGDLLVTAYSEFSRNRTFGQMIGRGYSVPTAESRMNMIAEGFPAVKGVIKMARELNVNMPVISATYRMLYKQASPYTEFKLLENQLR